MISENSSTKKEILLRRNSNYYYWNLFTSRTRWQPNRLCSNINMYYRANSTICPTVNAKFLCITQRNCDGTSTEDMKGTTCLTTDQRLLTTNSPEAHPFENTSNKVDNAKRDGQSQYKGSALLSAAIGEGLHSAITSENKRSSCWGICPIELKETDISSEPDLPELKFGSGESSQTRESPWSQ